MNTDKKIIQKIILAGLVVSDGKILILQRNSNEDVYPNMWELPSGKREPLESSNDSLTREIKEETGIDVEVIMPVSTFDYQVDKPEEIRDSTQINFIVTPKSGSEIKLSKEHQNSAWITEDEADNYELSEETKNVVRKAFLVVKKLDLQ